MKPRFLLLCEFQNVFKFRDFVRSSESLSPYLCEISGCESFPAEATRVVGECLGGQGGARDNNDDTRSNNDDTRSLVLTAWTLIWGQTVLEKWVRISERRNRTQAMNARRSVAR
jgi:hypothetical protein